MLICNVWVQILKQNNSLKFKDMFKQFSSLIDGKEVYLLCSLGIFVVFFVIVSALIIMMKKEEVDYMSALPLNEEEH